MDMIRRLLRPVRLPIPPRPHKSRTRPATICADRSLGSVDPDWLELSPDSLQVSRTATCALVPMTAGQEWNLPYLN